MRTLFFRLFLSFWLAMVLISATLAFTFLLGQSRDDANRDHQIDSILTPLVAQRTVEIYEQQGHDELSSYLRDFDKKMPWTPYFFDSSGKQLYGPPPTPDILAAFARAHGQPETQISFSQGRKIVTQDAIGSRGQPYLLVMLDDGDVRGPRSFLHATLPVQIFRAVTVVLITGAICFFLASYMTRPIARLREAAGQLATGNLSARVLTSSGTRSDELADLSSDFNHMAERIETLIVSQRRLTSDISHELRSPLSRLSVALGLARREAGQATVTYLDRIERESERMNDLIGRLLKLARLESGLEPEEFEILDIDSLVREVADDADFEARSRNRSVRVLHLEPCRMQGRWELLRSALDNVARNAVMHTAEATAVEISLQTSRDALAAVAVICVRDHGPGVPEEFLSQIFQPFYRVEEARQRSEGGTGLGLAITKNAVSFHKGRISAENAVGGGLLVKIILPLAISRVAL